MEKFMCGLFFGFGLFGSLLNLTEKNYTTAIAAFFVCIVSVLGYKFLKRLNKELEMNKQLITIKHLENDKIVLFRKRQD